MGINQGKRSNPLYLANGIAERLGRAPTSAYSGAFDRKAPLGSGVRDRSLLEVSHKTSSDVLIVANFDQSPVGRVEHGTQGSLSILEDADRDLKWPRENLTEAERAGSLGNLSPFNTDCAAAMRTMSLQQCEVPAPANAAPTEATGFLNIMESQPLTLVRRIEALWPWAFLIVAANITLAWTFVLSWAVLEIIRWLVR